MDEDSTKRKRKKRGRSLIFKACFRTPSNPSTGKILASDDNLVYCDVSNNGSVKPGINKSSSSRGRISRIFKAVLFDTAERIGSKKHSKDLTDYATSSPGLEKKPINIDNIFDENNSTVVKNLEENNSLSDSSNGSPSESKTIEPDQFFIKEKTIEPDELSEKEKIVKPNLPFEKEKIVESAVLSTSDFSINTSSPTMLTHQKVITTRTKSMDKKPPLPSRSGTMEKPVSERESKPATTSNPTFGVYLFILIGIFISVVLWMSYGSIRTEPLNVDSEYTNVVIGDEL